MPAASWRTSSSAAYAQIADCITNKMLSYRRVTALQGALQFSPKVEEWNCMGDNILRTL